MIALDGATTHVPHEHRADVVVVGSGPAGSAVARTVARAGARVAVLEEGARFEPGSFHKDAFSAMAQLYRDLGASTMLGRAPMPFVQGRAIGGTSVINGAISWRLPRDVYDDWVAADPALGDALPWETLERQTDQVIADLGITPTDPAVAGVKNTLMARGAEALGLEHRPIARNVTGCRGLGRCMQGCPIGAKQSMDLSYLADAADAGAWIASNVRVDRILVEGGAAAGVSGIAVGGGRVTVRAPAVVLACSAVQTPALLLANRIRHGPVGDHFQCHPGVSVSARFAEPVRAWTGATQGHEVTGLRHDGLKFEVLGFDMAVLAARLAGAGRRFAAEIGELPHWVDWGAAVKATAEGTVRPGRRRARVRWQMADADVARVRKGVRVLGELFFAAGAQEVHPGIAGWRPVVTDPSQLAGLEVEAPRDPKAYTGVATHLFGTCRMGSDPHRSVVGTGFEHHRVSRLYIADSSVFLSNIGVNPQTSILVLASLCGQTLVH